MGRYIRTIIADDDAIILKGMKKFIDWKQYGFDVIATADNGKDLLNLCEQLEVDVVITDIEMPKLNGLDAMKVITQKYKEIKLIVISGFDKFDYAKQSIQYGVVHYLLKPINPVELISVLNRLRNEFIDNEMEMDAIENPQDIYQVVRNVKEKIDKNEDQGIGLEYIQEHYFVSATYFSKVFKEVVGVSFIKYKQNHKMIFAKYLLEHTNLRLYEIAEKLNYEDERYFSRVFKKNIGVTPKEWREGCEKI